eukprot:TRINITY_DN2770_c0_g1_i11.p2 TRINITY_DN2770_c0_g1~~TRINITY_DN2770_c0_g1_i11.p2  ORF type:complete len:229 (+),score=56.39 TRINITY_DN2770_c0_g1_i11:283-969(+)
MNHFAIAKIRMIPKKDSLRPIMTFKRKIRISNTNQALSTSKLFDMSHLLLKNVKYQMVETNYGFAVFDYRQIFAKLETFIEAWKAKQTHTPLYFVSLDIEKCYDNVLSYDLKRLLKDTPFLASKGSESVGRYVQTKIGILKRKNTQLPREKEGEVERKSWKHYFRTIIKYTATPYLPQFDDLILTGKELNVGKSICSELPFRRSLKTDEVLAPLQLLLKQNIIMVNLS